jgi:hypothetical protein
LSLVSILRPMQNGYNVNSQLFSMLYRGRVARGFRFQRNLDGNCVNAAGEAEKEDPKRRRFADGWQNGCFKRSSPQSSLPW